MTHELPKLTYPLDGLEPYLSQETLEYHYGKHHKTYLDKLNQLIVATHFEDLTLEEIIRTSSNGIFNNAAQAWNHSFYWQCLSAKKISPSIIAEPIAQQFGSFEHFQEIFTEKALAHFGSGWTWLCFNDQTGKMLIKSTPNAETPLTEKNLIPLLTCDVWEHAYYIDYRNSRPKYLEAFWHIVNWEFVASQIPR